MNVWNGFLLAHLEKHLLAWRWPLIVFWPQNAHLFCKKRNVCLSNHPAQSIQEQNILASFSMKVYSSDCCKLLNYSINSWYGYFQACSYFNSYCLFHEGQHTFRYLALLIVDGVVSVWVHRTQLIVGACRRLLLLRCQRENTKRTVR